jgi:hypothetical protein
MSAALAEFRIDPASEIVLFQTDRELGYADWEHAVVAALHHSGGHFRRALSDRRRLATVYPPGLVDGITGFVLSHPAEFQDTRWALLMGDHTAAHTAANAAMRISNSTLQVKVFTQPRPALAWLLGHADPSELDRLEGWLEAEA